MELTVKERKIIQALIMQELYSVEKDEGEFEDFISNSPVFNELESEDIKVLADAEKYKEVLIKIVEKLK